MQHMSLEMTKQAIYLRNELRNNLLGIKDLNELADCLQGSCDINIGKFKSMSKRRRKIFLSELLDYFNVKKEEFVHRSKRHMKNVFRIPLIHTTEEKYGKPMSDLFAAWASNLTEE